MSTESMGEGVVPVEPAGGDETTWQSPAEGTDLPYDFVPVLAEIMKAEPAIWHHGSNVGQDDLYSGELRCTLTTLTPLLVGNQQFEIQSIAKECREQIEKELKYHEVLPYRGNEREREAESKQFNEKKIIVPLSLGNPETGPILIPGESLKGMLRQSLGALLNAPIERVNNYSFSYRPNSNPAPTIWSGPKEWVASANLQKCPLTLRNGSSSVLVPAAVQALWQLTQEHLVDDKQGHLARKHNVSGESLGPVEAGDVVFTESLSPQEGNPEAVVSFGRNFRYRWRHLNEVTSVAVKFDRDAGKWGAYKFERRPELRTHVDEVPVEFNQGPKCLTAARGLFGFVVDAGNPSLGPGEKRGLLALKDPFDRLAGRVSFNFAMERLDPYRDKLPNRFENDHSGYWLFLHPTAEPKPQFSRGYVPGKTRTWGDGVLDDGKGAILLQNGTTFFAGRKFYLHQGSVDSKGKLKLDPCHYDLAQLWMQGPQKSKESPKDLRTHLIGNQAAIARWVSKADRKFGFVVRFKQLRPYELAALVVALQPNRLAAHWPEAGVTAKTRYAHKLGHGRALGLGSVKIDELRAIRWTGKYGGQERILDEPFLKELIMSHLLDRLKAHEQAVTQWLKVLQITPYRDVVPYLFKHGNLTMRKWASDERLNLISSTRSNPRFEPLAQNEAKSQTPGKRHAASWTGAGSRPRSKGR